jgi:DNA-binding response OmpR family regulator
MYKIMLVEDDPALGKGLSVDLEDEGYRVTHMSDGREAYQRLQSERFDLLILDLTLPGKSGEDICRDLRKNGHQLPILMLTSKNRVEEKVLGFGLGADEYVTKPFDLPELHARIVALLRRPRDLRMQLDTYKFENVLIDFQANKIIRDNEEHSGSIKEFEVLKFLVQNEGRVVSRDDILDTVWGMEAFPTPRTVDNFILAIRKKIERDPKQPRHLLSIYGSGYKFVAREEAVA